MDHLFYEGVEVSHLWFQNFSSNSWKGLATLCGVIAGVCLIKYILATVVFLFFNDHAWRERKSTHSTCSRILYHGLAAIVTMVDLALGYMLMLAFMISNVWICGAIILCSGLFFFLIGWTQDYVYLQLSSSEESVDFQPSTESTVRAVAGSSQTGAGNAMPMDLIKEYRKSVEADQLISMSTFQRNQLMQDAEDEAAADATTLLIRPDLLAQESDSGKQQKNRSDSDPLLDKYPVLRFHNVEVKDTTPVPDRKSKALDFDELDELIKELKDS